MAIVFANKSFHRELRTGAFVSCRGSFEPRLGRGYNVIYLDVRGDQVRRVSELVTGFLPKDDKPWARPVGLLTDLRGRLFISSDDLSQCILVMAPRR